MYSYKMCSLRVLSTFNVLEAHFSDKTNVKLRF